MDNSREVLDKLNNVNNPSSIHTYDFSTLYTNLPLDLVRNELFEMIDRYFDLNERKSNNMETSLKLESMPTLCRSAFLPADTTITRRVTATIEVASSVAHQKEYCFRRIENNNILLAPQQLTREPL